jgi:hypothetical protein
MEEIDIHYSNETLIHGRPQKLTILKAKETPHIIQRLSCIILYAAALCKIVSTKEFYPFMHIRPTPSSTGHHSTYRRLKVARIPRNHIRSGDFLQNSRVCRPC